MVGMAPVLMAVAKSSNPFRLGGDSPLSVPDEFGQSQGEIAAAAGTAANLDSRLSLPILAPGEGPLRLHRRGASRVEEYFGDYVTVAAFGAAAALLVGAGLFVSSLIRPNKPNSVKSSTYECGIDPVGGGWSQSHIRYYVFALLFLVFDVEAVFIFPWAVNLDAFQAAGLGGFILVEMLIFIAILVIGLLYAVRKGVLKWE